MMTFVGYDKIGTYINGNKDLSIFFKYRFFFFSSGSNFYLIKIFTSLSVFHLIKTPFSKLVLAEFYKLYCSMKLSLKAMWLGVIF